MSEGRHILRRVELWNFKSHEHSEVRLAPGINAISGKNYAGKTSIVQAVGLCLYNSCVGTQVEYVRKGAKHALIHVEFVSLADERVYRAERRLGSGGFWRVWDVEIDIEAASGEADTAQFLTRHLRLRPGTDLGRLFEDAVGVAQGDLTASFLVTKAARKPIFDGLLRVEEYEAAWDKMRAVTVQIQGSLDALQQRITVLDSVTATLPDLEKRHGTLADQITTREGEVKELIGAVTVLAREEEEHAVRKRRCDELAAKVSANRMASAVAEEKCRAARRALEEAEEAGRRLEGLRAGHDAYQKAVGWREELREEHERRTTAEKQARDVEAECAVRKSQVIQLTEQMDRVQAAEVEAERLRPLAEDQVLREAAVQNSKTAEDRCAGELTAARKAHTAARSGNCPLLGEPCQNAGRRGKTLNVLVADRAEEAERAWREAGEEHRHALGALNALRDGSGALPSERRAAVLALAAGRRELEAPLQRAEAAVRTAEMNMEAARANLAPFATLVGRIEECKAALTAHKEAYEGFLRAEQAAMSVEEKRGSLEEASRAMEETARILAVVEEEAGRAAAGYDAAAHGIARSTLEAQRRILTAAETNLERDRKDSQELERQVAALRQQADQLATLREEHARQQEIQSVTHDIREAIRAAGPRVAGMMVSRVSAEADRLFGAMIGDGSVSLAWTPDYEIRLTQHGMDRRLQPAAGSEQVLAALAVRLALIESLGEVRFAFLDEPTIHLDEARRASLVERLGGFRLFDQLVVISHDDSFEARVGNVVRVEKCEGRSIVS